MDFSLGRDREMLADTLGRFLGDRYTIEVRHGIAGSERGYCPEMWTQLAELGIIGALLPERVGGFGGSAFDIATVFQAIGKSLVVEPFLGVLMASRALAASDDRIALLEAVVAGDRILAFAHEEPESHYDLLATETRAERAGDGWRLTGRKAVVPQVEAADEILVVARTAGQPGDAAGLSLFLVPATAAEIRAYALIDGGRGGDVIFSDVALPATALVGPLDGGHALAEEAIAAGNLALCWEAVGIMDTLKAQTLDYLKTRVQFGVAIGKFQALQHRMATVALEIEQARSAAINAAVALDDERRVLRERAVSAAKFTICRVGTLVAEEAIQMHGGIGMTWELPLAHHAKRLTMIGHYLGDEDHHLERFISLGKAARDR